MPYKNVRNKKLCISTKFILTSFLRKEPSCPPPHPKKRRIIPADDLRVRSYIRQKKFMTSSTNASTHTTDIRRTCDKALSMYSLHLSFHFFSFFLTLCSGTIHTHTHPHTPHTPTTHTPYTHTPTNTPHTPTPTHTTHPYTHTPTHHTRTTHTHTTHTHTHQNTQTHTPHTPHTYTHTTHIHTHHTHIHTHTTYTHTHTHTHTG